MKYQSLIVQKVETFSKNQKKQRLGRVAMTQRWERSPTTNVAWVQILDLASQVGWWVCWWFSTLLQGLFSAGLLPTLKSKSNSICKQYTASRLLFCSEIRGEKTQNKWACAPDCERQSCEPRIALLALAASQITILGLRPPLTCVPFFNAFFPTHFQAKEKHFKKV